MALNRWKNLHFLPNEKYFFLKEKKIRRLPEDEAWQRCGWPQPKRTRSSFVIGRCFIFVNEWMIRNSFESHSFWLLKETNFSFCFFFFSRLSWLMQVVGGVNCDFFLFLFHRVDGNGGRNEWNRRRPWAAPPQRWSTCPRDVPCVLPLKTIFKQIEDWMNFEWFLVLKKIVNSFWRKWMNSFQNCNV